MFVIEIRRAGRTKPQYVARGDALTSSKKEAQRFDKDGAELNKRKTCIYFRLPESEVFVRPLDDLINPKGNKFGAKQCYYEEASASIYESEPLGDYIRFDSKIEANVYQALRRHYPRLAIARQHALEIKPKTKFYPRMDWRVDFRLMVENKFLNIEVKGLALPEFKRGLQLLQCFNHTEWEKTIIVTATAVQIDKHKKSMSFADFNRRLGAGVLL